MKTNWNQLIERYLNNEFSEEDKVAFESALAQNKELQAELELHQLTHEVIRRNTLRKLVQKTGKWFHFKKVLLTTGIIVGGIALLTALYFISTNAFNDQKVKGIENELLEKMEKHLKFDNIPSQYFEYTGKSDVFLSKTGVMISLTKNSFLLNGKSYSGDAIVQWQEAQTSSDFAKAGLSTKAGDRLLETQGMFSINAFTPGGQKLELSKEGAYIQVPVDEVKEGMKLFKGVAQANGDVDWKDSVELERLPKQKSMSKIDLYPKDYEPKLNELKWHIDKKKRDSLYLSFENERSQLGSYEYDYFLLTHDTDPLEGNKSYAPINGNNLFNQKCAICHSPTKEGTGPKLQGVRAKWLDGGAKNESIYRWVRNWEDAYARDPYAREITKLKPTNMDKFPNLSNEEIDAIFDYADAQTNFIPPSKVLAIWNTKFDNTILATQEFEDRMKHIHETCNEAVLEIYTNNLNESLWKLDEQVVAMGYSQFQQFATQRVGKVKIDAAHQKNLNAFYEESVKEIQSMGKKNVKEALKKRQKWDKDLENERGQESVRKGMRESDNLQEEYNFNMVNVHKQLGVTIGFQMYGDGNIVNIDKYVMDATVARESTVITNPENGKTAQIIYKSLTTEVKNANQYGKLFIYLFSKEMNSYERLDFENGKLNYSLNGDMNYAAAIIGMNENGFFYHEIKNLKAGDLGIISLENISEKEFDKRINALNNKRVEQPMSLTEELQWLFKEKANYEVQKQRKKEAEFRDELRPVVFPCLGYETERGYQDIGYN